MLLFCNKLDLKSSSLTIFLDKDCKFKDPGNHIDNSVKNKINNFIKEIKSKKKNELIYSFDISEKNKCYLIKIKEDKNSLSPEQLGGQFFSYIVSLKNDSRIELYSESYNKKSETVINFLLEFIHGYRLKSYSFNKYKTSKKNNFENKIVILTKSKKIYLNKFKYYQAIEQGVFLTRNLVSEPPNILNPERYVKEIKKLSKIGLKINVYNEKKMKKLGMGALLGVGQGSKNESYLVTIEWKGTKNSKNKPLAFVGKGVCFDTGGISLKPARFMEEMKYDMAGSAVVVGLLKTLALRKAKVNAVGVVGLVENMPGSNAQRPGDIVKSFSGKTIEVLNTDAEGRLVLADALSFTEKKYKPKFIIDLATLTGAIIVTFGEEYAGLFSNDNNLSDNLFLVSKKVNEKVWRLPLHENYNKLMNSNIADVQNINYSGGAGSITAAEFLQRFILNKTPWVHLDIAGMAFSKKADNLNPKGATGFGVRLLNKLIKDNYEK